MNTGPETDLRLAVSVALGTAAYATLAGTAAADAVRFDNDGSFAAVNNILDITRPAASQAGGNPYALTGTEVRFAYGYDVYSPYYTQSYSTIQAGAGVATRSNPSLFVKAFDAGDLIGGSESFLAGGRTMYELYVNCWDIYYGGGCTNQYPGDFISDGTVQYAGVLLDIAGQMHYGWVGVVHNGSSYDFDVVAWGYETTPNTPVAAGAPTPSTLAGLALGAAAFSGRKRRD